MASQSFRVKNSLQVGTGVTITSGGNITAGVVTATLFVGNGSQLTGIVGNANYALVSGVSSSVVGGAISATSLSVTGVSTFDGAVKIRNGYNLNIGDNNDLRIYNDGTNSRIQETGSGAFYISGSDINIQQDSTNKNFARFVGGGAAELYYNDSKKFETSGIGITVTGTLVANQINLSGVATATTFFGNLTGTATTATLATNAQGLTGNPNITVNNISSSGIATLGSSNGIGTVTIGVGNTALLVQGNARITGILTVGTSSIVFDGDNNSISVGTLAIASGIISATSGIVTFYGDSSNTSDARWTLGADGSSNYTFTGIGFTQPTSDPNLYVARGKTYEFINNSGGSHPFQIRVSNGGAAYNNGITNNGAATGTIRFEVPFNSPSTLYYQCTNHAGMGSTIYILDETFPVNSNAYGIRTVQSGGSPTGGNDGDIYYIY